MKKYVIMILIAIVLIIGGGTFAYFHFANGGPWQGTWWGVQDAGVNWSGDHIRNLETGTGRIDGGRLVITPKNGGKELALSYSAVSRSIDTPFTNADKSTVTLKALAPENNEEMESIRSEIVQISQKPENKIDTTLSKAKS